MKHIPASCFAGAAGISAARELECSASATASEVEVSQPRRLTARRDLQAAADYGEYVYWVTDAFGRGIDMSHQWSDVTGFGIEESLKSGWRDAVHPDDYRSVLCGWRAAGRAKRNFACELRLRHRDGSYRWVQVRAKAKLDENRQLERWYGTLTDIEDRKVAGLALRTAGVRELHFGPMKLKDLERTACASHYSLSDHRKLADYFSDFIERSGLLPKD